MNRDLPVDMIEEPSTELVPATERAALALQSSKTEQHLLTLASKHASITQVVDKAGREQAHGAAMELTRVRTTVEKAAKEARDDATKFSKAVIAEAARLVAIVEPEESRLKAVRDAWDDEQARIKQEAARIERERLLKITERIAAIKSYSSTVMGCRTAERATELLCKLHAVDMTGFAEFEAEAARAHLNAITAVAQHRDALAAREAEAERLKAEREELARQQEEAKQKADELAAQQKAEADKLAAERAEFARQQQEAANKLAAQQAEIERRRAELEAAKAPAPAPVIPVEPMEANTSMPGVVVQELSDDDIVDAEIRAGFDLAMSAPIVHRVVPTAAPGVGELIAAISDAFDVDMQTACRWLCARAAEIEAFATETETA